MIANQHPGLAHDPMVLLSKLDELHERIVELSSEPTNLAVYERLRPQLAALDGLTAVPRTTAELTQLIEALQAQQRMHDVYAKQLAVAADGQATELAGALRELHSLQAALVADLASLMSRAIADHDEQLATERDARALAERETSELLEAAELLEMRLRSETEERAALTASCEAREAQAAATAQQAVQRADGLQRELDASRSELRLARREVEQEIERASQQASAAPPPATPRTSHDENASGGGGRGGLGGRGGQHSHSVSSLSTSSRSQARGQAEASPRSGAARSAPHSGGASLASRANGRSVAPPLSASRVGLEARASLPDGGPSILMGLERSLTLKQMRDLIDELYASKLAHDAKCATPGPRCTPLPRCTLSISLLRPLRRTEAKLQSLTLPHALTSACCIPLGVLRPGCRARRWSSTCTRASTPSMASRRSYSSTPTPFSTAYGATRTRIMTWPFSAASCATRSTREF